MIHSGVVAGEFTALRGEIVARNSRRAVAMNVKMIAVVCLLLFTGSPLAAQDVDYVRDVKPILRERCYSCHGAARQKAGLRLDTAVLIPARGRERPCHRGRPERRERLDRPGDCQCGKQ